MNQSVNYSPPAAISQYTGKDFLSSVSIKRVFMQCSVLVRWMNSFKHLELQIYSCSSPGSRLCRLRQDIFSSMSQSFALGPVVPKENNAIHWINLYLMITQLVSLIPIHWIVIYPPGGTQQIFRQGDSAPRSNPLPFYMLFFTKKVPLSYSFYWQRKNFTSLLTAVNALSFE